MPKLYFRTPEGPLFEKTRQSVLNVCERLGLEIFSTFDTPNICDPYSPWQILIENASFMLADITVDTNSDPPLDVFFEVGYAWRAQKSVLLMSQVSTAAVPQLPVSETISYDPENMDMFEEQLTIALIMLCNKERIRYNQFPEIPKTEKKESFSILPKQDMKIFNYIAIGDICVENFRYEEAHQEYSRAILGLGCIEPQSYHAYIFLKRGYVCKKLGFIDEALTDYSKALEMKSDYVDAYMARGLTLYDLKRYQEALADFMKVVDLKPDFTKVYVCAGLMYRLIHEYDKAIEQLNKAIELNPNYSEAFFNRGLVYFDLKDYEKSIDDFSRAIILNPRYNDAFIKRGLVYTTLQNYELAIQDFNVAIDLNPEDLSAYTYRGQALFEKGYLEYHALAIKDWQRAIELGAPNSKELEEKIGSVSRSI